MNKFILSHSFKHMFDYYKDKYSMLLSNVYTNAFYERWGIGIFSPLDYAQPYGSELSGYRPGYFLIKRSIPSNNKWRFIYDKNKNILCEVNYIEIKNKYFDTSYIFYIYNKDQFIRLLFNDEGNLSTIIYCITFNNKIINSFVIRQNVFTTDLLSQITYLYDKNIISNIYLYIKEYDYMRRVKIYDTNNFLVLSDINQDGSETIFYGAEKKEYKCYSQNKKNIPFHKYKKI